MKRCFLSRAWSKACGSGAGFGLDRKSEGLAPRAGYPIDPDSIAAGEESSVRSVPSRVATGAVEGVYFWIPQ
jgi:hypothetical protein